MQRIIISVYIVIIGMTGLSGCTFFPGVHKIEIQQGNQITQEMVDKLKLGMTQNQVRYILGTAIITDTFDQSRWDYFYSVKTGNNAPIEKRLTLLFTDEKLSQINGDFQSKETPVAPAK